MPLDLQKRLLRHILAQLRLFCEIELPNLDVLLGLSHVALRDVQLDPDKVSLPGFFMRYGQVAELDLRLGVLDGVVVSGRGVEVVLAPGTAGGEFLLDKSQADLARSMMVEGDEEEREEGEEDAQDRAQGDKDTPLAPAGAPPSLFIQRAVDMALARLSVLFENVRVLLMVEGGEVAVAVDKVSFHVEAGVRKVSIEGVTVEVLGAPRGAGGLPAAAPPAATPAASPSPSPPPSPSPSSSNSSAYASMSQSVFPTAPPLLASTIFSHEEASSLYMTANIALGSLAQPAPPKSRGTPVVHIDRIGLLFGKAAAEFEADVGTVSVSAVGVPHAVVTLANGMVRHFGVKPAANEPAAPNVFKSLVVEELVVWVTLGLGASGKGLVPDSMRLSLAGATLNNNGDELVYGGIDTIRVFRGTEELLLFTADALSDLLVEVLAGDTTLLLPKDLRIALDKHAIADWAALAALVPPALTAVSRYSRPARTPSAASHMEIQTREIQVEVRLEVHMALTAHPVSFVDGVVSCARIHLHADGKRVGNISKVRYAPTKGDERFKLYDHAREKAVHAKGVLGVETVGVTCSMVLVERLRLALQDLLPSLPRAAVSPLRLATLVVFQPRPVASLRMSIGSVVATVDLVPTLGTVEVQCSDVFGYAMDGGTCDVFVSTVHATSNGNDLVSLANPGDKRTPMVGVKIGGTVDVAITNAVVEYYGAWVGQESAAEPAPGARTQAALPLVGVSLTSCAIGLTPARLTSKLALFFDRGSATVSSASIASHLRATTLLLVDDRARIDPSHSFLRRGYVHTGSLDSIDVKVTLGTQTATDILVARAQLHLCADTAQCLVLTLSDLRLPPVFPYEDKFAVAPEVDVFDGVDLHAFEQAPRRRSLVVVISPPPPPAAIDISELYFDAETEEPELPVMVSVRVVAAEVFLHDGYDWRETQMVVQKTVRTVARLSSPAAATMYGSIVVAMPAGSDRGEWEHGVVELVGVLFGRSPSHRVAIVASGLTAKVCLNGDPVDVALDEAYTVSTLALEVSSFEILDNVPTSTWHKFATYLRSAGDRELNLSMVRVSMETVRPIRRLLAQELILGVRVLPLRLHVDQDTLDFLARFGEFKDPRFVLPVPSDDEVYLQRVEIAPVPLRLDYKPKKMDYAGLRSGRTAELANLFVLDSAKVLLRRIVVYGVKGFPALVDCLKALWTPDVTNTQLPQVLAGLAPVKLLVRMGGGVKDLVAVPVAQYQKDGRVLQGLQKGVGRFGTTTASELLRFGVKVVTGTQKALEGVAGYAESGRRDSSAGLTPTPTLSLIGRALLNQQQPTFALVYPQHDDDELEEEEAEPRVYSHYAHQPQNVQEGLHEAYVLLGRNFNQAHEAIKAVGRGEDLRVGTTAVVRPFIGAAEALLKTLMGVQNQFDGSGRQEAEDKWKRRDEGSDCGSRPGHSPRQSPRRDSM